MKHIIFTFAVFLFATHSWGADPMIKKGACLGGKDVAVTKKKIESLKAGWHYNWTPTWQGAKIKNTPFVPMFFGDNAWSHKGLADLKVAKSKMESSPLLGYNEPDGKDQSNMSVEKALQLWPLLEKTNCRLGSPVAVHPDNAWMKAFMKGAEEKGLRVDFICMHWYGFLDAEKFIKRVEEVHALYKKPIWITEFAIADWSAKSLKDNKHSKEDVLKFMQAVLPQLEKLDYVERYAWFIAEENNPKLGTSALFDLKGNLTELGEFYANFTK